MVRILIFMILILAASPHPALAQSDADSGPRVTDTTRSFTPWKLEAFRRRDVSHYFNLTRSEFQDSILGYRRAAETGSRPVSQPWGLWRSCPEGYRNGTLTLSLLLPDEHPAELSISLFNRDHELIAEVSVKELHPGRMDIAVPLDPAIADHNPASLLLQVGEAAQRAGISSVRVDGVCQRLGPHNFASFDLAEYVFTAGQSLILF